MRLRAQLQEFPQSVLIMRGTAPPHRLFKSPCALDEVAAGDRSRIVRLAVASLVCDSTREANVLLTFVHLHGS